MDSSEELLSLLGEIRDDQRQMREIAKASREKEV